MSPEIWAHIFKSRKSEKPCMEHWAKKFGKIAPKHVQNTCGHFWKRSGHFGNFEFFWFFWKLSMTPWNHGQKTFSIKSPQNTFGRLGTFLDNLTTLKFFWFFAWIFSKSLPQNISAENWSQIFRFGNLNSYL